MMQRYCEQCGIHTLHDDELCTVCFPIERKFELFRDSGPEVYEDEFVEGSPSPARLPPID